LYKEVKPIVLRAFWSDESASFVDNLIYLVLMAAAGVGIYLGVVSGGREAGGDVRADIESLKTAGGVVTANDNGTVSTTAGSTGAPLPQ
jgi:type IV secretory pathway TrbL component